ncbi:MAG: hypothetical protein ACI86M_001072, partial [Saprospiraceae bacterium]
LTVDDFTSGILVLVKTSESLSNLSLSVPALGLTNLDPILVNGVDSTEFTFEITTGVLPFSGDDMGYHFTGTDFSNNELISFVNDGVCNLVPFRDSDSTFVDGNAMPLSYGVDSIHGFYITCSADGGFKNDNQNLATRNSSNYETSVNIISASDLTEEVTLSSPQCVPVCSQNVTISISGGTEPYDISWSNNTYEGFDVQNMNEGVYQYTITDGLCGYIEGEAEITCFELEAEIISQAVCVANDGSISVTPISGEAPHTYKWNDGPTDQNRTGLSEGAYEVTVTDANGCTTLKEIDIVAPSIPLQFATLLTIIPSSCTENTGLIKYHHDVHKGGFPPYTYEWSNGSTDPYTISNLSAGVYTLTITDSEECSIEKDHVVPSGEGQPTVTVDTEKTCENTSGGEIEFYIYVEIGPYDIDWDPSLDNNITIEPVEDDENSVFVTLSDLAVGSYCISVTDLGNDCFANVCGIVNPIEITEDFEIQFSLVKPSCNFGPNGSITILPTGNIGSVDYQWSNGANSYVNNNLFPGTYSVTLTDECQQSISETFTIVGFESNINVVGFVKCVNTNTKTGTIDLTVTGINAPYSFIWNTGDYTEDITVSNTGIYTVRVTDKNGCYVNKSFDVGETEGDLAANDNVSIESSCDEKLEFLVTAEVSGGQAPYTYNWHDGSSESKLIMPIVDMWTPTQLKYSVTVTDICNDVIYLNNTFDCDEFCDNDCIVLYRTGKSGCVDECDDGALGSDVFGCDQLKVKSNCDNDQSYFFHWAAVGPFSDMRVEFKGKDHLSGTDEIDLNFSGPMTILTFVRNTTTGCSSLLKLYLPKRCRSIWNWIFDNLDGAGVGGGGNNGNNNDPLCSLWSDPIIDSDNCTTTWQCIEPPNNNVPDDVLPNEEFCYVTNPQGSSADDNLTLLYNACKCNLTDLHIALGDYKDYCECAEFLYDPSDSDNLICTSNPVKVVYDKWQDQYIYFTTEYGNPNLVTPQLVNSSVNINTDIVFANIHFENKIFVNLSIDTFRNIYMHTISDSENNQITKYDTSGNVVWKYDYQEKGKSSVTFNYLTKNTTRLIIVKGDEINTVDLDETGTVTQSIMEIIQGTYIRSETNESNIIIRPNTIDQTLDYNGTSNQWSIPLPNPVKIVGYSDLEGGNILMFYNYTQPFTLGGQSFSLSDQISSGAILLDAYGQLIKNIVFHVHTNSSINHISKGEHNEFAIAGYYSNSVVQSYTTLEDNIEFCSYIKGFKVLVDTDNSSALRKEQPVANDVDFFTINPNPAQNSVLLSLDSKINQDFIFNMVNSSGVSVLEQRYKANKGKNELSISLANIPAGVYFLRMKNSEITYSKKLIKI